MNWWNFSISDWSIEKIRAREKCARKILLFNAKLQDAKLETLLQKAFDEGMQLFEFDGNFFLRFNPATKRLIKTFNSPLNNVMTFTDDVDYTEKVTSILACLIPMVRLSLLSISLKLLRLLASIAKNFFYLT